jgi:hypothetical protein
MGVLPFAAGLPAGALATTGGRRKRLLVVMVEGGWDVTYCMDPKQGLDTVDGPEINENRSIPDDREAVQTIHGIPVMVNDHKRPSVRTFFEAYGDRVAVINGLWVGAIAHATARIRILNGTALERDPSWAAIAGAAHGVDLPLGSVDLSGGSYVGNLAASAGQLGAQAQLKALLVESSEFPPIAGWEDRPGFRLDNTDRDALLAHLHARNDVVRGAMPRDDHFFADRAEALERAHRFRNQGADAVSELSLGIVPSFKDQIALGVQLLETDLCSAVTIDSGQTWDTHRDNVLQHNSLNGLFGGLMTLSRLLDERNMWDDTLVAVISEMTRTPTFNSTLGKDHWPHTSCMLMGRDVIGGRVYGGTDDRVESLTIDPVTGDPDPKGVLNKYDNFAAGVLASLDVDPEPHFPTIDPFIAWKR